MRSKNVLIQSTGTRTEDEKTKRYSLRLSSKSVIVPPVTVAMVDSRVRISECGCVWPLSLLLPSIVRITNAMSERTMAVDANRRCLRLRRKIQVF